MLIFYKIYKNFIAITKYYLYSPCCTISLNCSFLWLHSIQFSLSIIVLMDTTHLHVLAIVINAAVNTRVYISFKLIFFWIYIPRNEIAVSYVSSIFRFFFFFFFWETSTIFHSGCISLHSHHHCMRVSFPLHAHRHLVFFFLFCFFFFF